MIKTRRNEAAKLFTTVIPAKARIHLYFFTMDSGLRRNDGIVDIFVPSELRVKNKLKGAAA